MGSSWLRIGLLVLVPAICGPALPGSEDVEGSRVEIRLHTTSDWTRVEVPSELDYLVIESRVEGPAYEKARTGPLSINKPAYDAFWETALASRPAWVLVTSWNEWHEGSEIEPSAELGEAYLERTREWVGRWKEEDLGSAPPNRDNPDEGGNR